MLYTKHMYNNKWVYNDGMDWRGPRMNLTFLYVYVRNK